MQKIIVRFDSLQSFKSVASNFYNLDTDVIAYNLDTEEVIKRQPPKRSPRQPKDPHDTTKYFRGFPRFQSKKIEAKFKVDFYTSSTDFDILSDLFDQKITNLTKSIWVPKLKRGRSGVYRAFGDGRTNRFPIYVVSKGRAAYCATSDYLSRMKVKHFVVVEPNEVKIYKDHLNTNFANVIELDLNFKKNYDTFSDLGNIESTGPGPARNFAWDHSIKNGFQYHWVFDDNSTEGFYMLYQNSKIKLRGGEYFAAIEDFAERFDNLAIIGLNYSQFAMESRKLPPWVLNTRIYSFMLIRNDIQYRWRGRYNEDTDLSLRVLKDGWVTLQFNSLLASKLTTQRAKGGNTDEFYDSEGTLNKSKMIAEMHPDVAKVEWKFNRWHHVVNYKGFKQRLKPNVDFSKIPLVDDLGIKIIKVEEPHSQNDRDYLENKYKDRLENYKEPIFYEYD